MACTDHCARNEDKHGAPADHQCIIREVGESRESSFQVFFLMKSSKTFKTSLKRLDELTFNQQPYNVTILILSKHVIKGISFLQIICISVFAYSII